MCPTICRNRVRAAGTTTEGSTPDSTVPAWIWARSAAGMDCGVNFAMSCRALAEAAVTSSYSLGLCWVAGLGQP